MILEESPADTIKITGLWTSAHHLTDEYIKILFGISLALGGREKVTCKTFHRGWSMLWCSFLDANQNVYER